MGWMLQSKRFLMNELTGGKQSSTIKNSTNAFNQFPINNIETAKSPKSIAKIQPTIAIVILLYSL
jgi:hypothetical protein